MQETIEAIARFGFCSAVVGLGAYMVWRSFNLLQKGLLTLKEVNPDQAIKVEFQKILSVQTRYPAIAFFVLALVCVLIGYSALPEYKSMSPIKVTAKVDPYDPNIIEASILDPLIGKIGVDSGGGIVIQILPKIETFKLVVLTPGYEKPEASKSLFPDAIKNGVLDFGTISPGNKLVAKPIPNRANIDTPSQELVPYSTKLVPYSTN